MRADVDTVLFDLGAVLIDWNPRYLYQPLFNGDDQAMERFLAEIVPPEWNLQIDAGKPFSEAVAERIRDHPQHAELIAWWTDSWTRMLREAMGERLRSLCELW